MNGDQHSWLKGGAALDTESVRQHYDAWADDYDATLAQWNYRAPSEAAAMLKPLIPADAAILDFGAGTGLSGQAMRDAGFTGRLDGSDVSPRSVEIARERGVYSDVRVVDGNALPLPYETDSYDAAISIGVLTYIADVEGLLRELARATRPGGYLLFTHREDLARDQDFPGMTERLAQEGVWSVERITDPQPYLPGNPDFADEIGVLYALLRVASEAGLRVRMETN